MSDHDNWRRQSYSCLACRDIGLVTCWHASAMQSAIHYRNQQIDEDRYRKSKKKIAAPCTCDRGDKFTVINRVVNGKIEKVRDVVRYCSVRMVMVDFVVDDDTALLEWADDWLKRHAAGERNPVHSKLVEAGKITEDELVQMEAF